MGYNTVTIPKLHTREGQSNGHMRRCRAMLNARVVLRNDARMVRAGDVECVAPRTRPSRRNPSLFKRPSGCVEKRSWRDPGVRRRLRQPRSRTTVRRRHLRRVAYAPSPRRPLLARRRAPGRTELLHVAIPCPTENTHPQLIDVHSTHPCLKRSLCLRRDVRAARRTTSRAASKVIQTTTLRG